MALAQLPASTVKLITSSQIITSVSTAVKELFENALDAGATSVDVKLINFGLDRIEVKDNGCGVSKENTTNMALPHYTSKISDFKDLDSLKTYGFRGEALNALCRMGQVTITTATSTDSMALVYTLDSSGNISASKPAPYVQGTTVVVTNLFKNLPVRRQLMGSSKKAQEELKGIEMIVKSLAVIKANIRVSLHHNKCLIWQKTPCSSLQSSFSQFVGYSCFQLLEQMCVKVNDEVSIVMLVPKRDCDISILTKSTPAFSLIFVNERPVIYKKILKILHQQLVEAFGEKFSTRKFSVCLISIYLIPSNVDVNLEPNKTKVLLKDEDVILNEIQTQFRIHYSVPNFGQKPDQTQNEVCQDHAQQRQLHSPLSDSDDDSTRKRRKIDEELSQPFPLKTLESTHKEENIRKLNPPCDVLLYPAVAKPKEQQRALNQSGDSEECAVVVGEKSHESFIDFDKSLFIFENPGQGSTDHVEIPMDEDSHPLNVGGVVQEITNNVCVTSANHHNHIEAASKSQREEIGSDLEHLWDHVDAADLNELSMCLDGFQSDCHSSNQVEEVVVSKPLKGSDLVGTEAWSLGHVNGVRGNAVKGSCVLVRGHSPPVDLPEEQCSPTLVSSEKIIAPKCSDKTSACSPRLNPTIDNSQNLKHSPQQSPRATGIDSSLQSVSSQMGRRELAAFTKFAREIRPQIILENPGIAFTLVASMLAEKWQNLTEGERDHYEEMARETAVCKKVWKSYDNQTKLEWIKKLPAKGEINKTASSQPSNKRPPRREVNININMDIIRSKVSNLPSVNLRQEETWNLSGVNFIGRLEPSGTWVILENSVVALLNHSRLQEVVVNHRLMGTHSLPLKPSPSREQVNEQVLGEEAWKTLLALPCTFDELRQANVVTANIILKNGFKIEMRDNKSAVLTEVAEVLNYYGPKELKETLILGRQWPAVELAECRPLRVANHIKSEAMRICRKAPSMLEQAMVEELIEYWATIRASGNVNCLHSKPIIIPIYDLVKKANVCSSC